MDVELEEDGSLALRSLKALCANATGWCFSSENGRRRSVRVVDDKNLIPALTGMHMFFSAFLFTTLFFLM